MNVDLNNIKYRSAYTECVLEIIMALLTHVIKDKGNKWLSGINRRIASYGWSRNFLYHHMKLPLD